MEPETGLDLGDASGFMGFPAFNQKDLNDKNDRDNIEQSYCCLLYTSRCV